jgi:CHASE3 domain sensor protein
MAMSLSLKNKTNIAFVTALITLAVVGWFSIQRNRRTQEVDHLVSHGRDVIEAGEVLRSHVYDASVARRTYTLPGDPTPIEAFSLASKAALADFATLNILTTNNAQQQVSLAEMEPLIKARISRLRESVETHERTRDDVRKQKFFNDQSTKMTTQITDLVDKFTRAERALLQDRSAAAQASDQRERTINIFLGICVLLFLVFTLGLLNRERSRCEQAEHSAAEQKELLQSILDICSDAVIVANTDGKIILRNPVGSLYNACAPADELSEKYPELLGLFKSDRETMFKTEELPLSRALKGSSEFGLEICVRPSKEAEPQWMLADGGPLLNVGGERRGGVVFLRDITDRKKADEQLKHALLKSEALAKERKELSVLGDSLQSCQTAEEIYRMSEGTLPAILDFRPGTLSIINSSRDLVESVANWESCSTTEPMFHPDDCWALRRRKAYGPHAPLRCSHVTASVATNYLCVPLVLLCYKQS